MNIFHNFFSLAQLFSAATAEYECQIIFYSSKLHEEHIDTFFLTKQDEELLQSYSDNNQEDQEEAHVINILDSSVSDPIDHEYE